ncbi:MAG TPA: TatD family hydrolase [Thermoanaerobaculia bacterium]|nr:TatD family hydrolase [Thermoanaerobaculia bacterium]
MRLADSHCHLAMLEPHRAIEVLDRARSAGVCGFVVPATSLQDASSAVAAGSAHDDVWSAVGFHPHEAKDCDATALGTIRELAGGERVVAIGEIGLDYHYMHSPRDVQRDVLLGQLAVARELDLPVIVHNRESTGDLLAILTSPEVRGVRGVLHSFTEDWQVAKELLDLGLYISFSGILTFRTAETIRDAARKLPMDRVLIETDTPYLAPVPQRGKENEPAFIVHIAETLAGLWHVSLDRVAEATSANFETLFGVKIPS